MGVLPSKFLKQEKYFSWKRRSRKWKGAGSLSRLKKGKNGYSVPKRYWASVCFFCIINLLQKIRKKQDNYTTMRDKSQVVIPLDLGICIPEGDFVAKTICT
jgi:hypothetical protein